MSKLFVDWIAAVLPFEFMKLPVGTQALDSDANILAVTRLIDAVASKATPHFGYRQAWTLKSGATMQYNDARPDMGINVIYPGSVLTSRSWVDTLKVVSDRGHITRLDVTIDVFDPSFDLEGLYKLVDAGQAVTKARRISFIQSSTGQTLYVGDRASERMLRIYDKGGEQGNQLGEHWRIEAELKGKAATSVAKRLIVNTDEGYGVFKAILDCPDHRGYTDAVNSQQPLFEFQTDKRRRDTLAWLFGLVARTMAEQERLNPGTLAEFVATVNDLISHS